MMELKVLAVGLPFSKTLKHVFKSHWFKVKIKYAFQYLVELGP